MSPTPDSVTGSPPRWSLGGVFLEALGARDHGQMVRSMHPDVRLRAMLPRGPAQWHGAEAVADVFTGWFGHAEDFELLDAAVGEIAGRLHLSWRLHLRPAPSGTGEGWHVIEQQAYLDASDAIDAIDLLCSGFRPERRTAPD